jgi:site-specific DNA recombinase
LEDRDDGRSIFEMEPRVAIYVRLSHDRTGQQTATTRQRDAAMAFAALRGWTVVKVYEDVDLSAFQPGVVRPEYEALLTAIDQKVVDGVVAWKLDRLVRRPVEFERFWALCQTRGVFLASVTEPLDTSTELGLAFVRILVAFASLESATSGLRLRAKMRERAEQGQPHPSAPVFGYKPRTWEVDAAQAALIREAAGRVLRGDGLIRIVRDWDRRGVPTVRGGRHWSTTTLRGTLLSRRIVGEREHLGEVVAVGQWEPILDRVTAAKVRAVLLDPSRRKVQSTRPHHLLSRFIRCGRCGANLRATGGCGRRGLAYGCPPPPTGCSRISVSLEPVEVLVIEATFKRIARRGFPGLRLGAWPADPGGLVSMLDEHAAARKRLAQDYYVDRVISREEFLDARAAITVDMEVKRRDLTPQWRAEALVGIRSTRELRQVWGQMSREQRRTLIATELSHVIIEPRPGVGGRFDPTRVKPIWWSDITTAQRSDPQTWLDVDQAAQVLGLSRKSTYKAIRSGFLRADKVAGRYRVRRPDVDALLASRRVAPGSLMPGCGQRDR